MGAVTDLAPGKAGELLADWLQALHAAGCDHPAATEQGALLLQRWNEPRRRYHDLVHLSAVLDALDLLCPSGVEVTVRLAAWFHDAVYEARPGADEEASAVLAEQVLDQLGAPVAAVAEVARLVRLTATHDPAVDDLAGALLVDADLAVLAGSPADYARYTEAIRQEYVHVPDPVFRIGRAAVLRALLDKPFLYRTSAGRDRFETAARANVCAEIAGLETG
jgi:predicted metal-dependent HD superfamily phosphohydrolase